jgi:hypothetical protein
MPGKGRMKKKRTGINFAEGIVALDRLYRAERTKLDAAQLAARLNGTTLESSYAAASSLDADGVAPSERGALGATLDPFAPAEFSDGGEGPRDFASSSLSQA